MRSSYTLGPTEIQEAVSDWLQNNKEVAIYDDVKVTFKIYGKDGAANRTIEIAPAEELEVTWGEPE